jgi:hypothetical protein
VVVDVVVLVVRFIVAADASKIAVASMSRTASAWSSAGLSTTNQNVGVNIAFENP